MATMSRGECQWAHCERGVTQRPWTVGVLERPGTDSEGVSDMVIEIPRLPDRPCLESCSFCPWAVADAKSTARRKPRTSSVVRRQLPRPRRAPKHLHLYLPHAPPRIATRHATTLLPLALTIVPIILLCPPVNMGRQFFIGGNFKMYVTTRAVSTAWTRAKD